MADVSLAKEMDRVELLYSQAGPLKKVVTTKSVSFNLPSGLGGGMHTDTVDIISYVPLTGVELAEYHLKKAQDLMDEFEKENQNAE